MTPTPEQFAALQAEWDALPLRAESTKADYSAMADLAYRALDVLDAYAQARAGGAVADVRGSFERWMSDDGLFPPAIERSGEGYRLAQAQSSWEAWQGAAKAFLPSAADKRGPTGDVWRPVQDGTGKVLGPWAPVYPGMPPETYVGNGWSAQFQCTHPPAEAATDEARVMEALQFIARQKLAAEMPEEDRIDADYESGYEAVVRTARAALQEQPR